MPSTYPNSTLSQTFFKACLLVLWNVTTDPHPSPGHVTADGEDTGKGYNINIAFSGSDQAEFGDPEYLGAFR